MSDNQHSDEGANAEGRPLEPDDIIFARATGAPATGGDAGFVTRAEIEQALRQIHSPQEAAELAAAMLPPEDESSVFGWDEIMMGLFAMLSPEHHERVRRHRGWTAEVMEARIAPARALIARARARGGTLY